MLQVGGDLKIWDSGFSSVNFESLETVGGDMELSGDIEEYVFPTDSFLTMQAS